MLLGARVLFNGGKANYHRLSYITSPTGYVCIPLDFVLSTETLTAKHTIVGSVAGPASDARYNDALFSSVRANNPSSVPKAERSGFKFSCSNPDRRHTVEYGLQGWWNGQNVDNYSYNEFHTFAFQHSSTPRRFMGTYTRDGISVNMYAMSVYSGTTGSLTSDRDPTYNSRPVCLFGAYDYNSTDGYLYRTTCSWKFSSWKIELGEVVLHEYIAASVGDELGVYDIATGNFFTNRGIGSLEGE